jgi:hypothetical protein
MRVQSQARLASIVKTTLLVSGSRQEDNLQSIVYAVTPTGLLTDNVPTPLYDTKFAARV